MRYILPFQISDKTPRGRDEIYKQLAQCSKPVVFSFISQDGQAVIAAAIEGYTIFTDCPNREIAKTAIIEFLMNVRLAYPNAHTKSGPGSYTWKSSH